MKLSPDFFNRDVLDVAPDLIGKILVRKFDDNTELRLRITETEAYRGQEDKACHAHKGRTPRTETMFMEFGTIYIYLIYGMYWMLNIVTEKEEIPQAVLIRALEGFDGPGKLTRKIKIDKTFNNTHICNNNNLHIEDDGYIPEIVTAPRIGIDYAGKEWIEKPWRYIDKNSLRK
ncbi:MAG: DNA-3-methyladenine glycosylase [Bacteroidales bacterium]|jgi:DNA-3-methyladenine glycosylase|nr:DNA-3-methyladenine glycosylase [Bacteroidales bacterium]